jgi:hypothetical protein
LGLERSLSPRRVIHKASSTSILIGMDEGREAEGGGGSLLVPEPVSAPPVVEDFEDIFGEVEEDDYGEIIECPDSASKPIFEELHMEGRPRGSSFASLSLIYK